MSKSSVRLALLTSVTCCLPPVSRQMRKVSIVPNRISPRSARARRPGIVSSRCLIFVPEKYASTTRPVLRRNSGSWPSALRRSQIGALTRLCQTMAFATGVPVCRSHSTVVSRWLVTPMAAMSAAVAFAAAIASRAVASWDAQIASGSCSTSPGAGKICGNSCCADATARPSRPKTMARLEVVP